VGLIANTLEGAGMSTVLITTRPDVSEGTGAPRMMRVRFPMGNSVGEPNRPDQQRTILRAALELLTELTEPGRLVETSFRWRRM
jgi:hypothetical protein